MNIKDLPLEIQQKYIGEIDVDGMSRIQFYAPDLAYRLRLSGTIAEMRVDDENGQQVLRMTVIPRQASDYKTMYAPDGTVALPAPMRQPRRLRPQHFAKKPELKKPEGKSVLDLVIERMQPAKKEPEGPVEIEWVD